jgi:hypothetical protein
MTKTTTAITSGEGEYFLHMLLWHATRHQLEDAEKEHPGSGFNYLAAMVLAFNTLEAYLNFIGARLDPTIWKDEQNYFRKSKPSGFRGKIKKVYELSGLAEPNEKTRPYSSVWEAKAFRDMIAHAKTEKEKWEIEHAADTERPHWTPRIETLLKRDRAKRFADDISSVIESIHEAARRKVQGDIGIGEKALSGLLGYSSGGTRIKA